jgi:predicted nucleic acid-binding protein
MSISGAPHNLATMMSSLFVDTSGWGCHVDRKHPLHDAVRAIYQEAISQHRQLVTTNYVVAELVALLQSRPRFPRAEIIAYVDSLLTLPHLEVVHVDHLLHTEAWALLKARPDKEWSLVDASSFVLMQQRGRTEALTTDRHFEQAGFVRLPIQ